MPRVFQVLRRRRRPLLQITSFRFHAALANQPDQCPRLPVNLDLRPANDTPAGHAAFHEAPRREAAAYVAQVGLHLRRGDLPRAEALFRAAPASARDGILDNVMLNGYAKAGRLDHARRLFDGMATKDLVAWNTLVSGYCRAGRLAEARALFDAMPIRTMVSSTAMVQGYFRAGMLREAREMFDAMPERDVVTWKVMVKAYAYRGHCQEAVELFDRMPWRNLDSWITMISGFLHSGRVDEAVRLFERMQDKTVIAWNLIVTGLARNGRVSTAREFFDRMPENKDIVAWNGMITAYAKNGQMSEARRLFDLMPAKDVVSWSIMIDGYAMIKLKDEAVGFFLLMLRSAVSPDSTTLISVMVTSENKVEVGQIHGVATKTGLLSKTPLGNTLLTMYSRSGSLHSAWRAFKMLQEKDDITWTSMMQAFLKHGRASYALQAFAQMLRHGHDPSSITFTAALSACRQAGLFEKCQNIFRSIYAYGIKPTIEHRDILIRIQRRREAMEVVTAMPPETRGQEMEFKHRKKMEKKDSKKKSVEDSRLPIEEPAGAEAVAATECTPTKGVFGWAVAYLKALVGK